MREDLIRGSFSAVAAAALGYMVSEFITAYVEERNSLALFAAGACAALMVLEVNKVGTRIERIVGLR